MPRFMNPKVTVLMPAYNAGKYIAESIQSIINQTYGNWELLIVNDGSTDNTVEVVNSFNDPRIRLLNNPENLRLIKTLNRGLEEAKGEYIARLDSDDNATPNRLQLQVDALDADPDLALVGGRSNVINAQGKLITRGEDAFLPSSSEAIRFALMFFNPFRHSAVTFRRDVVRSLGGYPLKMQNVEDFGLWCQLTRNHRTQNLIETVCDYRVHDESVMTRAKTDASVEESEPRIVITRADYFLNAKYVICDDLIAQQWANYWPQVQYGYGGDCKSNKVRRIMAQGANELVCVNELDFEHVEILSYGLRKLSRYALDRKCYITFLLIRIQLIWLRGRLFSQ